MTCENKTIFAKIRKQSIFPQAMEKKAASLYDLMEANLNVMRDNPDIIQRFQRWMILNAGWILIDKRTLDFEACSPQAQRQLKKYIETLPQFDYEWTGVNYSVRVSLKGEMTPGTFVPGLGHFEYVGPAIENVIPRIL